MKIQKNGISMLALGFGGTQSPTAFWKIRQLFTDADFIFS